MEWISHCGSELGGKIELYRPSLIFIWNMKCLFPITPCLSNTFIFPSNPELPFITNTVQLAAQIQYLTVIIRIERKE